MMIESGTQIGTADCPGCAAEIPVKVNVAGGVYYFCAAVLEKDENGKTKEKCFTRFNYGRTASRRMISQYLEKEKEENAEQSTDREEENAGGTEEPRAGNSVGATLKHFLTGD